jgi:nicotinate-nucleotide adenylyltransferase
VDTVNILKGDFPDHELIYLMGGDSLHDLPNWYKVNRFVDTLDGIGVMRRPGDDVDLTKLLQVLPQLQEKLNFVTAPLLEISADQIRRRAREKRSYRYYLLPKSTNTSAPTSSINKPAGYISFYILGVRIY